MLTKRDIINYLNNSNSKLLTSKSIALHFSVTPRTIRNYIKDIKEEYKDDIEISKNSIKIKKILKLNEDNDIPLTFEERKSYILQKLLITGKAIDLDILSSKLCISEVTLQNEIKKIRRYIARYHLVLKTKNNKLLLVGTVKDKKTLIIQLIYDEAGNHLVSLSTLNDIFPNYNVEEIHNIIMQKLNENHFFIDEYSLINLLLHILISMNQAQSSQNSYESLNLELTTSTHPFVSIIDELCEILENMYDVKFTDSSKYQFTLLLMTRSIKNKELREIETTKLSVSNDITILVNNIISSVYKNYNIDLNVDEFIIAFSLHIKNMLIRLKEKVSVHNPLLYSIKSTSPFIYDIAVYISNIISKQQNVTMYDDEIAYIALHIGVRIEELNSIRKKLKVTIICPHYYSHYNNQLKKIESYFHEDIMINSIITNPKELNLNDNDFIISTIPVSCVSNYVVISTFFNDDDKDNISKLIKHIKRDKSRSKIAAMLKKLIDKDLFKTNCNYISRDDAINKMANTLIKKEYVSYEFTKKIFEREEISPTNFGMVAIPHPIDCYSQKTVLEISILEEPVSWGNSSVKIIFMFSISKFDFSNFSDVFSFLASICNNYANLEFIINSKSYNEFINNILKLY